jgi:periplasmic protein TonB
VTAQQGTAQAGFAMRHSRVPAFYGASLALHALLFAAVLAVRAPIERRAAPVAFEIVESSPAPAPPRAEPAPEAPRPLTRPPPPRRFAKAPPPPGAPPPRAEPPAPPPNQPPPPDAPTSARPRIGISMESTTTASGMAAPVGNTLYGRAADRAEDPSSATPYRSERYAPPSQVTTLPEPLGCDIPRAEYPEEARRLGIEGEVRLRLVVDEEGRVREARVVRDPGHGFGEVAARAARAYCHFRPARKDGAVVATEIPYTIKFEL